MTWCPECGHEEPAWGFSVVFAPCTVPEGCRGLPEPHVPWWKSRHGCMPYLGYPRARSVTWNADDGSVRVLMVNERANERCIHAVLTCESAA